MTTYDIVQLDCRLEENANVIQRALAKIKPLSKYAGDVVPMDKVEKCMKVLCNKYGYTVSISMDPVSNSNFPIWQCSVVKCDRLVSSGSNVFGCSLYEAIAKAVILMYSRARRCSK